MASVSDDPARGRTICCFGRRTGRDDRTWPRPKWGRWLQGRSGLVVCRESVVVLGSGRREPAAVDQIAEHLPDACSTLRSVVSITRSASSGASYGDEMPVKSGISPTPGLGVQPFAVAPLTLFERRRDPDEHEVSVGLDHSPNFAPRRSEWCDGCQHGHAAVPCDLSCDPAEPTDVGVAVRPAEAEAGRQHPPRDVAVQDRQERSVSCSRSTSPPRPVDFPDPESTPVKNTTSPRSPAPWRPPSAQHRQRRRVEHLGDGRVVVGVEGGARGRPCSTSEHDINPAHSVVAHHNIAELDVVCGLVAPCERHRHDRRVRDGRGCRQWL